MIRYLKDCTCTEIKFTYMVRDRYVCRLVFKNLKKSVREDRK